jgi:GH25 family lysozyme M1 (1,4-beta-N-acetylmuramidase)
MILAGLAVPAATAIPAAAAGTPAPASGVDVSGLTTFSSGTPWTALAQAGNTFVGVKATEGNYYVNTAYGKDVAGATAAGLYVMPYVFANPYPGNGTAVQQADYAWTNEISKASPAYSSSKLMLPLVLDIEADPYASSEPHGNQCYGLTQSALVTWIQQFLAEAKKKTNKTPIIYTAPSFWSACTGNSAAFSGYPLWLASYGVSNPGLLPGWNNLTFWQYTSGGTAAGIKGGTDLDYLGPVLQVSRVGTKIAPVQLRTLNSLNGQAVSYGAGPVAPGLTVNAAGQITGTPTAIGSYQVTVTPSTAGSVPAAMTFTWDVHGTLAVNSPGNRTTAAGSPVSLRITATDQDGSKYPPSFAASGLPAGLSMNSAGLITGWPSKPGTFSVRVSASDGLYATGSASFTWTVKAAPGGVAGAVRQVGGSGKCLNDPQASMANGTLVNLWSCNGHTNQNWTTAQDGTLRVLGKCLDVAGESKSNGAKLQLWSCLPGDGAQQWQAGSYGQLVNPQSGKCLYVPVANAANGARPVLWTCANVSTQSNEHWNRPAASVLSGEPGKCLAAAGTAVDLAGCANVAAQHWTAGADGTFRLGGQCLTATGTTAGAALSTGSCNGAAATKWTLIPAGPIATEIASTAAPGLCVTVPPSGTALVTGTCAATQAATWHIE